MKITIRSGVFLIMVVIYCYLERENYIVFKFHFNDSSLK